MSFISDLLCFPIVYLDNSYGLHTRLSHKTVHFFCLFVFCIAISYLYKEKAALFTLLPKHA